MYNLGVGNQRFIAPRWSLQSLEMVFIGLFMYKHSRSLKVSFAFHQDSMLERH